MTQPIRVLMVEDSEDDALLMLRALEKGGYEPEYRRVETAEAMRDGLAAEAWDLILCDYKMPRFDGLKALALYKEAGLDIPFILVSGTVGEEIAVEVIKAGAHDYIMKDKMARLVPAVQRELRDARLRLEHKKTEEALRESNERYRHLFALESDAILLIDNETGRILEANRAAAELYGYGREELLTKRNTELSAEPEETRRVTEETPIAADQVVKIPLRHHRKKDGTIFPVEVTGRFFYWKDRSVHIASIRDITERRRAEEEIVRARRDWENIFQAISHPTIMLDPQFNIIAANKSAAFVYGLSEAEMIGRKCYEIAHGGEQNGQPEGCPMQKLLAGGRMETTSSEMEFLGGYHIVSCTPVPDQHGQFTKVIHIATDITELKQVEQALRESEERYRSLVEKSLAGVYVVQDGRFVFLNHNAASFAGYRPEELVGRPSDSILHPEDLIGTLQEARQMLREESASPHEFRIITRDGRVRWIMEMVTSIQFNGRSAILGNSVDVTERRRIEQDLRDAEQRYRSIFENAQEAIYRSTPEGKIILANPAMARMFGYDSPEELVATVTDIARQHYAHPEERERIKAQIERHGSVANIEMQHCRRDGSLFWASMTMQAIRDEKGRLLYYEGIDEDITDRKEGIERLRKALGGTVQAISMAVETKDPYTAGHQRRTADLARAIATEMGLDADQRDFIRTAATIHDIGKIALPAEILSKPTKLTEIEFSLIKTHALQGYEILKGIEFPWPVADVVLQHHERIDGSGYPAGLKGEDILLEARILSVADVVEAIASHRPYRPAHRIDDALDEISKNRGILYDAEAVDACLTLFREKMYHLS